MQNPGRVLTEHYFGRSSSFSQNADDSWAAWYIWTNFCILMHFNIARPLVNKSATRLHRALYASRAVSVKILVTVEPHDNFVSHFEFLCIYTFSSHAILLWWFTCHHLPSCLLLSLVKVLTPVELLARLPMNILGIQALLLKIFIALEPHDKPSSINA